MLKYLSKQLTNYISDLYNSYEKIIKSLSQFILISGVTYFFMLKNNLVNLM